MLTKIGKALGLTQPNRTDAEQAFLTLALKGKCAGDTYYHDMSQSSFDSVMEGDEEEAFYHIYVRQREIGVQAFQDEVANELSSLSGKQLQAIVQYHNYNCGDWLFMQLIAQARCEFASAMCIYWANQPAYIYRKYQTLDLACLDLKDPNYKTVQLLGQIEHRTQLGTFAQTLSIPSVECFLDGCQPDYCVKPFASIPVQLRVYL